MLKELGDWLAPTRARAALLLRTLLVFMEEHIMMDVRARARARGAMAFAPWGVASRCPRNLRSYTSCCRRCFARRTTQKCSLTSVTRRHTRGVHSPSHPPSYIAPPRATLQVLESAQLVGRFLNPASYLALVLPHVAGDLAANPAADAASQAAALAVLNAMLAGALRARLRD